jgi:ComF family protein
MLLGLWNGLLALTWPVDCLACGVLVPVPGFCADCSLLVEPRDGPSCPTCDAEAEGPCDRCRARPPPFARAWGRFTYGGPVGDAIRAAKYRGRPDGVPAVARLLAAHVPAALHGDPPTLVVPVPLHPRRVAERGMHVPHLLAASVARVLGVPLRARALRRVRHTPAQAELDDEARRENVSGVFAARRPIDGADVLLVDDVVTTGATVSEAARVLLTAGASRVRVLAAAYVERRLDADRADAVGHGQRASPGGGEAARPVRR